MNLKKYQNINLRQPRQQGFTIVELLIVIIVIAILAALVITAYTGVQAQARESAAKQKAGEIEKALVSYHTERGTWPSSLSDLNSGNAVNIDLSGQVGSLEELMGEGNPPKDKPFIVLCPVVGGAIIIVLLRDFAGDNDDIEWRYLGEVENNMSGYIACATEYLAP